MQILIWLKIFWLGILIFYSIDKKREFKVFLEDFLMQYREQRQRPKEWRTWLEPFQLSRKRYSSKRKLGCTSKPTWHLWDLKQWHNPQLKWYCNKWWYLIHWRSKSSICWYSTGCSLRQCKLSCCSRCIHLLKCLYTCSKYIGWTQSY